MLLFATVGNAQVFGVDLVLVVLGPVCVVLFGLANPAYSQRGILIAMMVVSLAYAMLLMSMRFDSLTGHTLWSIKAVMLALFVAQTSPRVRTVQVHLLFVVVLVLYVTSSEQYGRSYGLFGPNMLYRFYGLLFLASFYMISVREGNRIVWTGYIALALAGIVQTGSVGGALLIATGAFLFLRFSIKSMTILAGIVVVLLAIWDRLAQLVIVNRLLLKITQDNILTSSRMDGASRILAEGFALFGHPYEAFNHIWRAGYEYPHNIFLELFAFYGLLGILVSIVLLIAFVIVWRRIQRQDCGLFDLTFIAFFVGTLLSGDLSDNYGIVGMAISIVVLRSSGSVNPARTGSTIKSFG